MRSQKKIQSALREYGGDILKSESFQQSRQFVQHGSFSVWRHSLNVAQASLELSQALPFQFSERALVRGALLHDYFQYDWHKRKAGMREIGEFYKMHGFTHPEVAARNARRDFQIGNLENEIIRKHMWPLTIMPPMCREAWIVTIADKYCSLLETFHVLKGDLCG
jgi:uncharacterized protein